MKNFLQEAFLQNLLQDISAEKRLSNTQEDFFLTRFNPQNEGKALTIIAHMINHKNGGFSSNPFTGVATEIAIKFKTQLGARMREDGVDIEKLVRNNPGRTPKNEQSPYEIINDWIWKKEFPRKGWEFAKNFASYALEQFQMLPLEQSLDLERSLDLDEIEDDRKTIQTKTAYKLEINLQKKGYLLLINESKDNSKFCMSPSLAYTPKPEIYSDKALYLPQKEAGAKAKSVKFTAPGDEYFLAIVTKDPLYLSWLKKPDTDLKTTLALNEQRLHEIFVQLGKQSNSQLFFKTFKVIA